MGAQRDEHVNVLGFRAGTRPAPTLDVLAPKAMGSRQSEEYQFTVEPSPPGDSTYPYRIKVFGPDRPGLTINHRNPPVLKAREVVLHPDYPDIKIFIFKDVESLNTTSRAMQNALLDEELGVLHDEVKVIIDRGAATGCQAILCAQKLPNAVIYALEANVVPWPNLLFNLQKLESEGFLRPGQIIPVYGTAIKGQAKPGIRADLIIDTTLYYPYDSPGLEDAVTWFDENLSADGRVLLHGVFLGKGKRIGREPQDRFIFQLTQWQGITFVPTGNVCVGQRIDKAVLPEPDPTEIAGVKASL